MSMYSFDHLGGDVVVLVFLYECSFETRVTEDLLQPSTTSLPRLMHDTGSIRVVETEATIATTPIISPIVSPAPNVFLPYIFLPGSHNLVGLVTVAAPRARRASTKPADGSGSFPSFSLVIPMSTSDAFFQVPSLDHSRERCTAFQWG